MEDVRLWASDQEDPIQALVAQFPEFFQDSDETSDDVPALIEGRGGNGINDVLKKRMLVWIVGRDTIKRKSGMHIGLIQATELAFSIRVLSDSSISQDALVDIRFQGVRGQFSFGWKRHLLSIIGGSREGSRDIVDRAIATFVALHDAYVRHVKMILDEHPSADDVESGRVDMKKNEIKDVAKALTAILPESDIDRYLRLPGAKGLKRTPDEVSTEIVDHLYPIISCLSTTTYIVMESWQMMAGPLSSKAKISANVAAIYNRIRGTLIGARVGGFETKLSRKNLKFVKEIHAEYLECARIAASFGKWLDKLFRINRKKRTRVVGEPPPAEEDDVNLDSVIERRWSTTTTNNVFDVL